MGNRLEYRVVADGLVVAAPHAERHAPLDRIGNPTVLARVEIGGAEIRADRQIAARNVISDARGRYVLAITNDSADGHRVAEMTISAEDCGRVWFGACASGQLL